MFASIDGMIVSEKMKHAVYQPSTQLAVVGAAPAKRLAQSGCRRDYDLTRKRHSALTPATVLEAQDVGGAVPSAKPPIQIPHRPVAHQDDGYLASLRAEGVEGAGTE